MIKIANISPVLILVFQKTLTQSQTASDAIYFSCLCLIKSLICLRTDFLFPPAKNEIKGLQSLFPQTQLQINVHSWTQ